MNLEPPAAPAAEADERAAKKNRGHRRIGSMTRRMIGVAALWIAALLLLGGFALDRVLSRSIVDSFDNQMVFILNSIFSTTKLVVIGFALLDCSVSILA